MPVSFTIVKVDPRRRVVENYQQIIVLAIERSRPDGEPWSVAIEEEKDGAIVRFDFARGSGQPQSLSFAMDGGRAAQ